jgi:multiple RNA-binding domain-containing protein 1
VIFSNNSDAKKAFRKLAYKRFKSSPLYLEWASLTIPVEEIVSSQEEYDEKTTLLEEINGNNDEMRDSSDEIYSIYVKNLNFHTTEDALRRVFEKEIGQVRSVRIPTKLSAVKSVRGIKSHAKEESIRQSMGFGFVEFRTNEDAMKALKLLQGKIIDGHEIQLSISKSKLHSTGNVSSEKTKKGTKIIVRNVPFQASRNELLQLFGSFGHLKTVRLPKKYDGSHRGFAFVEFTGYKEAQNAMKALAATHLYGRHLVLEWASDAQDFDSLQGNHIKRHSLNKGFQSDPSTKRHRTK